MLKYVDILNKILYEDCQEHEDVEHNYIRQETWTKWQDYDGIFVVRAASNSEWGNFCTQEEAEEFAAKLGSPWKVQRRGIYKTMSDEEAMADHQNRHNRVVRGFYVWKLDDEGNPIRESDDRIKTHRDKQISNYHKRNEQKYRKDYWKQKARAEAENIYHNEMNHIDRFNLMTQIEAFSLKQGEREQKCIEYISDHLDEFQNRFGKVDDRTLDDGGIHRLY